MNQQLSFRVFLPHQLQICKLTCINFVGTIVIVGYRSLGSSSCMYVGCSQSLGNTFAFFKFKSFLKPILDYTKPILDYLELPLFRLAPVSLSLSKRAHKPYINCTPKFECSWNIYKCLLLKSLRFNGLWWNRSDPKRVLVITMFYVMRLDYMWWYAIVLSVRIWRSSLSLSPYIYNINYV